MNNFSFQASTEYIFGKDKHKKVGEYVKKYADSILLVYGGGSIKKNGVYDDIISSLKSNNISVQELNGIQANPIYEKVEEGLSMMRKGKMGLILAVGGGSVIDTAKAIALGAETDDVWNFFKNGGEPKSTTPVATILTIPAAGSEVSPDAVITNKDRKLGYGNQQIRPVFSIINPEIFTTLPKNQIANGVCDMMSHIFERYFTQTKHTELIDSLCESTLKTIMRNAEILVKNPKDYDAWCEVSLSGSFAHNGFLGCGRIQDWGCHGMEHELSAIDEKVAHGAGLAVLTPTWMRYVYTENKDMFYQFAINVMGVQADRDVDKTINRGIDKLQQFFTSLGQPSNLRELGFDEKSPFEEMAKKACGEGFIGNFKPLYWQDVKEIYTRSL